MIFKDSLKLGFELYINIAIGLDFYNSIPQFDCNLKVMPRMHKPKPMQLLLP